jgi:hypothetical protein
VFFGTQIAEGDSVPPDEPNYKELCEQYLASIKALRLHVARYHLHSLWLQQIESATNFESGKIFSRLSAPRDVKTKPPQR